MDLTHGLVILDLEMKTPICMGWRLFWEIFGGPGRMNQRHKDFQCLASRTEFVLGGFVKNNHFFFGGFCCLRVC